MKFRSCLALFRKLLIYSSIGLLMLFIPVIVWVFFNRSTALELLGKLPIISPKGLKYCRSASDCVHVGCRCHCSGCGGFSYEDVVNKDYVDKWYKLHSCSPAQVCPHVCCAPVTTACQDGTCRVVTRTKDAIPQELLDQEAVDQQLCSQTGGEWLESPSWDLGSCQCQENQADPKRYFELGKGSFIAGRGCVNARQLCDEVGGVWKKPEIGNTENREDIPQDKCVTIEIYTLMRWDEVNNLCILDRIGDPNPKCLK